MHSKLEDSPIYIGFTLFMIPFMLWINYLLWRGVRDVLKTGWQQYRASGNKRAYAWMTVISILVMILMTFLMIRAFPG